MNQAVEPPSPVFGIVQGRLIKSPLNELQWFPQQFWESEFLIGRCIGLSYIELFAERKYNPDNPIWKDEGIERIKELSSNHQLLCYSFCNDYIIDHKLPGNDEVLNQNIKLLKQGSKLGMTRLILPLFEKSELNFGNYQDYVLPLREIADRAQDCGIVVCLESIMNADELIEVLSKLNHPNIKVVYDTGNRAAFGHDIPGDIRKLDGTIQHVHLKDKNEKNQNVLLGTGKVNFFDVFAALHAISYKSYYTFETYRGKDPISTAKYNVYFSTFLERETRAQ